MMHQENHVFINIAAISLLTISITLDAQPTTEPRPSTWGTYVEMGKLENCYLVDEGIYRSEQPSTSDMKIVESKGITTVVNLRNVRNDRHKARNTKLKLVHIPINTWRMDYDDVVSGPRAILAADKPVLLHCIHGSDRTGVVIASYRMVEQGWTKEAAIDEFLHGGYGYHSGWFPNILRLLESLDVEKLKADVK